MKKNTIKKEKTIMAHPDLVWTLISQGSGVDQWMPTVTSCHLEGSGPGATRTCETKDGKIVETIIDIDYQKQWFEYEVLSQEVLAAASIRGRIAVSAVDRWRTNISWEITFNATNEDIEQINDQFTNMIEAGFKGLEKAASKTNKKLAFLAGAMI